MRLHDLRPADGSRTPRTRVGRGIAAGKGKTAGRGTKGQKSRSGGSIPPWFEGGQTPLHMRIPKLRGFKNRFKIEYEVVNVGAIGAAAERGAFEVEAPTGVKGKGKAGTPSQITVNQDILRAVGLVRTLDKPLKILGGGELYAPLLVVADALPGSARAKIEGDGGTVSVLEVPAVPMKALGVEPGSEPAGESVTPAAESAAPAKAPKASKPRKAAAAAAEAETIEAESETAASTSDEADAPSSDDA